MLSEDESTSDIIAIPVKKKVVLSTDILQGKIESGQDWTDVVFVELMKRTDCIHRNPFILFKYFNLFIIGTTSAGIGAGAVIGALVGLVGGPIGIAVGVATGAVVGAATGAAVGLFEEEES